VAAHDSFVLTGPIWNGSAVQLRPTVLTTNAGAQRPPLECYHDRLDRAVGCQLKPLVSQYLTSHHKAHR
jgi:hypothetical protein